LYEFVTFWCSYMCENLMSQLVLNLGGMAKCHRIIMSNECQITCMCFNSCTYRSRFVGSWH
jgi:hypothetical protein